MLNLRSIDKALPDKYSVCQYQYSLDFEFSGPVSKSVNIKGSELKFPKKNYFVWSTLLLSFTLTALLKK